MFFQDEARVGQKGRVCYRWYKRGQRQPGRRDQRYTYGYIFGAVKPGTDNAFALILPEVSTEAMQADGTSSLIRWPRTSTPRWCSIRRDGMAPGS